MTTATYRIVLLPHVSTTDNGDPKEHALISKSRAFRLEALQRSSDTFASRYEEEVLFPLERTRHRHSHALGINYAAMLQSNAVNEKASNHLEWVGSLAGYGPEIETPNARATFSFAPVEESTGGETPLDVIMATKAAAGMSLHYHWSGMYVSEDVRGRGIGAALLRQAMKDAEVVGRAGEALEVRHTIALDADNISALKLYQKVGFLISKEGDYKPKPKGGIEQEEKGYLILERSILL